MEKEVEPTKAPEKEYIDKDEALEKLLKASDMIITLVWMAATMSIIAAINSLDGQTVLIKGLIFMIVGLVSLVIYNKRYKKKG